MSSRISSGRSRIAASTAASAKPATPTTAKPGRLSNEIASDSANAWWSSTIRTVLAAMMSLISASAPSEHFARHAA